MMAVLILDGGMQCIQTERYDGRRVKLADTEIGHTERGEVVSDNRLLQGQRAARWVLDNRLLQGQREVSGLLKR